MAGPPSAVLLTTMVSSDSGWVGVGGSLVGVGSTCVAVGGADAAADGTGVIVEDWAGSGAQLLNIMVDRTRRNNNVVNFFILQTLWMLNHR